MQLSSCANLYAIIFVEVKCREVLVVVGGIVTMTPNVRGLAAGWVFDAVSDPVTMHIKERNFDENVKLINERSAHNQRLVASRC